MSSKVCVNCFSFNQTKLGLIRSLKRSPETKGVLLDYNKLISDDLINIKLLLRKIDIFQITRFRMISFLNTINAEDSIINTHILTN